MCIYGILVNRRMPFDIARSRDGDGKYNTCNTFTNGPKATKQIAWKKYARIARMNDRRNKSSLALAAGIVQKLCCFLYMFANNAKQWKWSRLELIEMSFTFRRRLSRMIEADANKAVKRKPTLIRQLKFCTSSA